MVSGQEVQTVLWFLSGQYDLLTTDSAPSQTTPRMLCQWEGVRFREYLFGPSGPEQANFRQDLCGRRR